GYNSLRQESWRIARYPNISPDRGDYPDADARHSVARLLLLAIHRRGCSCGVYVGDDMMDNSVVAGTELVTRNKTILRKVGGQNIIAIDVAALRLQVKIALRLQYQVRFAQRPVSGGHVIGRGRSRLYFALRSA